MVVVLTSVVVPLVVPVVVDVVVVARWLVAVDVVDQLVDVVLVVVLVVVVAMVLDVVVADLQEIPEEREGKHRVVCVRDLSGKLLHPSSPPTRTLSIGNRKGPSWGQLGRSNLPVRVQHASRDSKKNARASIVLYAYETYQANCSFQVPP